MIHDIGKVTLQGEPELVGNPMVVEEMHYVRLHPHKGYLVALEKRVFRYGLREHSVSPRKL